ncbi:hypothetical protein [Chthonobacter rhizosphaerae]|uniref:hypothetical protein n=1 Tax=Chthonobacter rhizosphaerae TaxID=2735553 RepID=UPI0015EF1FBC|nr:hypothetical protein [Chthonobacter rhizosphaerae]
MPKLRVRIEEMEYRPEEKMLCILATNEYHEIVTIEIAPVYPRQLAADLDFVSRHPNARVVVDDPDGERTG